MKEELDGDVRRHHGRREGVEDQAGGPGEELLVGTIPEGSGREAVQNGLGNRKLLGVQRPAQRRQGVPLLVGRHRPDRLLSVAPHRVGVVEPSHHLRGGFGLVAVVQVEGHQRLLHGSQGLTHLDRRLTEAVESRPAHVHHPLELRRSAGAVVPEVNLWVGASRRPGVLVGDEGEAAVRRVHEDILQGGVFVGPLGKVGVSVTNEDLVPIPDPHGVGLGEIDGAVAP